MPFNLEQFRTKINENGLFQANRGILRILPPPALLARGRLNEIEAERYL